MSMILFDLTIEQKIEILMFLLIMIAILGILHLVKIKYQEKIERCNNKIIKAFFKEF